MNKPIHESETRTVRGLKELLPDRWKLIKLKLVCNIETGFAFPSEAFGDTGTPVIRITDIKDREINLSEIKRVDDQTLKSKPKRPSVNKGDILMAMTGATIGKVGYYNSDKPSYLNQRVCRFIPANIDRGYLWHTLNSEIYKKYIELEAFGGAQANISDSQLLNFPAPLPELEAEQQKIAQFLDYETAKIDALIDEQKRLIELLKEKRQAVISHAVTKGLNPDAPMKDSGVEWLGDVPEHWEVAPLKYRCQFKGGGTPAKDNLGFWGGDIPWISPKDMKSFRVSTSIDKITQDGLKNSSTSLVPPESMLLVARSGILQRTIPVAVNTVPVSLNQDLKALSFKNRYLAYFCAFFFIGQEQQLLIQLRKQGATVESLEQEYLENCCIAWPPIEELKSICTFISEQLEKIEKLTSQSTNLMVSLKERRSALISAAVTGKIDVRDWQPPEDADLIDSNAAVQMERQDG